MGLRWLETRETNPRKKARGKLGSGKKKEEGSASSATIEE